MSFQGYLGIDAGTQGLSVVLTDESLNVVGTGEGGYEMCPGMAEGCYEQHPNDWIEALQTAMIDLREKLKQSGKGEAFEVLGIGISGQMHGEVLVDADHRPLKSARLWCDARNEAEGRELTSLMNVKMPKRITAARWLWTIRTNPELAEKVQRITTPGGWLAHQLTGEYSLGIGDAAGMFPIDQETLDYDQALLDQFDQLAGTEVGLKERLPMVRVAGADAGALNEAGAKLLGLPAGIPVAPAEGDQPASLAGSLIANAGMVAVSFGTSVCANSVGHKRFTGVSDAVDHFCAPDGKPINMVWLRNGTTYMNTVVEMFGKILDDSDSASAFAKVMPDVVASAADCGGLLALPFMDDEPGLGVHQGGTAMLIGINGSNATPGNAVKAAMLATMFNLRIGCEVLDGQGFPRTELVLSGGLTRTPELGQVLADVMNTTVTLFSGADEGCAWGAALMAKFRTESVNGTSQSWSEFLATYGQTMMEGATRFTPIQSNVDDYDDMFERYRDLLKLAKA